MNRVVIAALALGGQVSAHSAMAKTPDRSFPPELSLSKPWKHREPVKIVLENQTTLHYIQIPFGEATEFRILMQGTDVLGRDRAAAIGLLGVESQRYSSSEVTDLAWDLDFYLEGSAGPAGTVLRVSTGDTDLSEVAVVISELLSHPQYSRSELRSYRRSSRSYLEKSARSADGISQLALDYGWYPSEHQMGERATVSAIRHIRSSDLYAAHARMTAAPRTILVATSAPITAILQSLKILASPTSEPETSTWTEVPDGVSQETVVGVNYKGGDNTTVSIRSQAPLHNSPHHPVFKVLDFALAQSFNSRLHQTVIADAGLAYTINAYYDSYLGNYTITTTCGTGDVQVMMEQMASSIAAVCRDGLTSSETQGAYANSVRLWNEAMLDAISAADFYEELALMQIGVEDATLRMEEELHVSAETSADVATQTLCGERLWVVVGDKSRLSSSMGTDLWITPTQLIEGDFELPKPSP